jgi:hypothetical protein
MIAGRDRKPTPVRCWKGPRTNRCLWRTTLRKHPLEYKRPPKCGRCGKPLSFIDFYRIRKEWKKKPCHCYGYAFPHARGRGYCDYNPKLTAEDLRLREEGGPRREANDPPF